MTHESPTQRRRGRRDTRPFWWTRRPRDAMSLRLKRARSNTPPRVDDAIAEVQDEETDLPHDLTPRTPPLAAWDDDTEPLTDEEMQEEYGEPISEGSYTSPLLAKMQGTRLTVEMLQTNVPLVQAAAEAEARLAKSGNRMSEDTKRKLNRTILDGDRAKETLFIAALPLIRSVAAREWQRRQQWGSHVTLEDLTQEAIIGFLKGISGFKVDAIGRSATNYLGQWMLVETRRAAEVLDHDLQVGHDAGERFRRIRALRNRLANEYDREPTDAEIVAASKDPNYVTRPGLVGRAPKEGEERQGGKGVTLAQVAEERAMRTRVGHAARFGDDSDADDTPARVGVIDLARDEVYAVGISEDDTSDQPGSQLLSEESRRAVSAILTASMDAMRMPPLQREIIERRFGIPPYPESSAREIARVVGIQRDKVSKIIAAFQQEMTRKGGAFHSIVIRIDPADLHDLGLGWTLASLGPFPEKQRRAAPLPAVLTAEISTSPPPPPTSGTTHAQGWLAWFLCDYHDRTFSGLYQTRQAVPRTRPCPSCNRPSERIKVAPATNH